MAIFTTEQLPVVSLDQSAKIKALPQPGIVDPKRARKRAKVARRGRRR